MNEGASALASGLSETKRRLLEAYLRGDAGAGGSAAIRPRPPGAPVPLSYGQQLLWLHGQLAPELPVYNEPITVHRAGPLDVEALEASLTEVVRRHEAWRTTFALMDGQPVQRVQAAPSFELPVVDLRGLPRGEREAEALRLATEDARQPFDLAQGPLLRAKLIRLDENEHRLFLPRGRRCDPNDPEEQWILVGGPTGDSSPSSSPAEPAAASPPPHDHKETRPNCTPSC